MKLLDGTVAVLLSTAFTFSYTVLSHVTLQPKAWNTSSSPSPKMAMFWSAAVVLFPAVNSGVSLVACVANTAQGASREHRYEGESEGLEGASHDSFLSVSGMVVGLSSINFK
jgi:hypothetical protein